MRITFNGSSAVDIEGHDNVEPGATVEVSDELGECLLMAGSSIDSDGNVTPPADPLWTRDGKKSKPEPAAPAVPPVEGVTEGN